MPEAVEYITTNFEAIEPFKFDDEKNTFNIQTQKVDCQLREMKK